MALGVGSSLSMLNASLGVSDAQKTLSDALKKLASGKKPGVAGFDAGAALVSEKLNPGLVGAERRAAASETAANVARVADDAAGRIGDLLKEARSVLAAASKGGMDLGEVSAGSRRLGEIVGEVSQIADSAKFGRVKVFDGNQTVASSPDEGAAKVAVPKLDAENLGQGATYAGGAEGERRDVTEFANLEGIRDALTSGNSDKIGQALGVVDKALDNVADFRSSLDDVRTELDSGRGGEPFGALRSGPGAAGDEAKVRELSKVTVENIRSQVKMALMAQGKDNTQNLFQLLL